MLPGPIFRREVRAASGGRSLFTTRLALAVTLAIFVLPPAELLLDPSAYPRRFSYSQAAAARFYSAYVFAATVAVQVMLLAMIAAASVAASIAEEREKDTLPLLLLTRLTRLELVGTKFAGRLMPALLANLIGLPLIVFAAWFAGLPALVVVEVLAMIASTAAAAGGLGILASSRRERVQPAVLGAIGWTILWLVGLPVAALMPVRSGTLWGELLVELRRLAGWLAPSSPLSLITDRSWFASTADASHWLSDRILLMMAMQAGLVVAALAGAVGGLRRREPRPMASDPDRGYRPPVGDDPIFWREYEMPYRALRGPLLLKLVRRLLIVLRTIVLLAIQAMVLAAAGAMLIGTVVAAGWYGYFAFRETWGFAPPSAATSGAREQLNGFILFVTFFLGPMPMMGAGTVESQITFERDRKTWESLLMTPMTGAEILSSKRRVVERALWAVQRWLIPLWLLGIVCGALNPLGVALAAVGLVTGTGLGLALGLRAAIRPRATPTGTVGAMQGAWYFALMLVGALTVIAPLMPGGSFEGVRWLRSAGTAGLVAIAIAMTIWERRLTRVCFARFDEWVGRPHRAAGGGREGRKRAATDPDPAASASASARDEARTPSAAAVD